VPVHDHASGEPQSGAWTIMSTEALATATRAHDTTASCKISFALRSSRTGSSDRHASRRAIAWQTGTSLIAIAHC